MPSTSLSHPKARHYHSVASRRATAQKIQDQSTLLLSALSGEDGIAQMKKRMEDEELERVKRTSEDPELVGELAAEENKRRRKEGLEDVLEKEDKRWDWLLTQMGD
ncbi:hypothetical protein LZ554_008991 [Drepanopeziza brunnea f. sp. 'monogermtubi']|nr:hypothetical protein LZ554_008991 [Drepanopeziza brunnea f. sp. 'monogermtubi']